MNSPFDLTRRHFLGQMTTGLTGVALSRLFTNELAAAPLHQPHFAPRAKQVLQIFCPGAASHIDLWDHKPMLEKVTIHLPMGSTVQMVRAAVDQGPAVGMRGMKGWPITAW